ncbi:segregation and condensation protein A [Wenzhouxiangella marina]|uniref:Segregation and condensation protein A n=1 Tax=Wenzhouxiangella marina TaxID=1579979 RepID=A0A0K0XWE5_9GAMM|nr:ScpA family protein [Wenzhouxiangella marina]AKS42024.1 chromosome segregation protein ScpA [Wenzhouxiangella marina]MBB6086208.1 segregation and condensation protein A [Wenzhouxiangella marina]
MSDVTDSPVSQAEMPFAVVQGQPLLRLPDDLYIPPDALEVFLEAFEGPLDLLLYLIRRQNLDILDIPIAEITRQYTSYIEMMAGLKLELAAEYLVMAAILAEIKSRMLLPRPEPEEEDEGDPRAELIRRLQEYERFKQAAEDLDELPRLERDLAVASAAIEERGQVQLPPDVDLKEILLALRDVMARAEMLAHHHVQAEPLSVRERMSRITDLVSNRPYVEFGDCFDLAEGRIGAVVTFLALLELLREHLIDLVQQELFGSIYVRSPSQTRA